MSAFKDYRPFDLFICDELKGLPQISSLDLEDLQGDLKELTERNYRRLRKSIKQYGFMVPLFVWFDPADNKPYTLDGNQRLRFIRHEYPAGLMLPYVKVSALDRIDAKERLLCITSAYGEVTKEGFDFFCGDMPSFEDHISDFTTFSKFVEHLPEDTAPEDQGPVEVAYQITVTDLDIAQRESLAAYCLERGYSFSVS